MVTSAKTRIYNSEEDLKARKEELKELRESQRNRRDEYERDMQNVASSLSPRITSASPLAYTPPTIAEPIERPAPELGAKGFAKTVANLPSARAASAPTGTPSSPSANKKKKDKSDIGKLVAGGTLAALAFPETAGKAIDAVTGGFSSLVDGLGFGGAEAATNTMGPHALGEFPLAPEAGAFDLGGIGAAGNAILPIAGTAFALDHLQDFGGKRDNPLEGALRGGAEGAAIASYWGMPWLGAGIGAAIGLAGSFIKSGKHADQISRDSVRSQLVQSGLTDQDFNLTRADGTKYNIGNDGGATLANGKRVYELDLEDPLVQELIPYAKSLIQQMGLTPKQTDDFVGYYVNMALSNAGGNLDAAKQNLSAQFQQAGLSVSQSIANLDQQLSEGKIDQQAHDVMVAKAKEIALPDAPQGGGGSFGGINVNYNFPAQEKQPLPMPDLSALAGQGIPKPIPPQNFLQGAAQSFGGLVNNMQQ